MKHFKRLFSAALILAMLFALASCGTSGTKPSPSASAQPSGSASPTESNPSPDTKVLKVGVIQYAPHPSLDNCYTGLLEGLKDAGLVDGDNIKIDFQNAQGEMSNSDMIAKNMVSSKYDLIVGIATPSAMSAYSAAKDTDIPVVFSAVSDAVAAGIIQSNEKPGYNCTGTSDVLPLEAQMKMIRAFLPDAKKIGILYTTSEPNSVTHLAKFKDLAPDYGFEIVEVGVTNASEVAAAATTLASKGIDCINNFTDNNVVNNLSSVLHAADAAGIPVFGSEVEQVKNGCLASQSIDYVSLGRETGKIAAEILKGEKKASEIPVALISDCTPVYNKTVADKMSIALPDTYKDAENVGTAEAK